MKQLTANVLVETGLKGANHGVVTTSDGMVLIDTPHKPSDAMRSKGEVERASAGCVTLSTPSRTAIMDRQCVRRPGRRPRGRAMSVLTTDLPRMSRAWPPSDRTGEASRKLSS